MTPEYQVAALWIGGRLSYLEQLCLISFVHAGQHIRLYTYEDIPNVPPGVEVADASEIMPRSTTVVHKVSGSPAPQADAFRYRMLAQLDRTIWADTDAYCVKPFTTANGHFHGWETEKTINNGVLGLPQDSETLRLLIELTSDPYRIPPYLTRVQTSELEAAAARGEPMHAGEMPWGVWGPKALTHFLHVTGDVRHSLPPVALYPLHFRDRRLLLRPNWDGSEYITDETFSIHFYGRRMRRRLVTHENGIPRPRSMFGQLLKRHGIDPRLAPIPLKPGDPGFGSDDDDDED
ncbi:MAG: hypothetical protein IPL38_18155 [Rhodobacter sp.]|nr:hypothetical protein [Rhodobacter sp.]